MCGNYGAAMVNLFDFRANVLAYKQYMYYRAKGINTFYKIKYKCNIR